MTTPIDAMLAWARQLASLATQLDTWDGEPGQVVGLPVLAARLRHLAGELRAAAQPSDAPAYTCLLCGSTTQVQSVRADAEECLGVFACDGPFHHLFELPLSPQEAERLESEGAVS